MYIIGDKVPDPFGREEYVTITGHDSVKGSYSAKTKSGKDMSFAPPINSTWSPKTSTPNIIKTGSSAPIKYHGVNQPPASDPGWAKEQNNAGVVKAGSEVAGKKTAADAIESGNTKWSNYQKAIAGANFITDVMNANSAYALAKGQAQFNIMQSRNDASDAIYRGRLAQFDRQSEGYSMGQDAKLAMAAQGQDVSGAAVERISSSYEAIGYEMGAREMINAYREVLGYELEEIQTKWQLEQAGIARDNAITSSALNTVVTLAAL